MPVRSRKELIIRFPKPLGGGRIVGKRDDRTRREGRDEAVHGRNRRWYRTPARKVDDVELKKNGRDGDDRCHPSGATKSRVQAAQAPPASIASANVSNAENLAGAR